VWWRAIVCATVTRGVGQRRSSVKAAHLSGVSEEYDLPRIFQGVLCFENDPGRRSAQPEIEQVHPEVPER
jgi:hypothetical protein